MTIDRVGVGAVELRGSFLPSLSGRRSFNGGDSASTGDRLEAGLLPALSFASSRFTNWTGRIERLGRGAAAGDSWLPGEIGFAPVVLGSCVGAEAAPSG